jgi:hypothetical protein
LGFGQYRKKAGDSAFERREDKGDLPEWEISHLELPGAFNAGRF